MKKLLVALLFAAIAFPAAAFGADTIKIGFNIPLTGDIPKVGEMSKDAAEMLKEKINGAGGLDVGGKKYMLDFVYVDNEARARRCWPWSAPRAPAAPSPPPRWPTITRP